MGGKRATRAAVALGRAAWLHLRLHVRTVSALTSGVAFGSLARCCHDTHWNCGHPSLYERAQLVTGAELGLAEVRRRATIATRSMNSSVVSPSLPQRSRVPLPQTCPPVGAVEGPHRTAPHRTAPHRG
jgi:hypothetical protein